MAWSDMVSTSANRARFITLLVVCMKKYGSQGADLDWKYPVDEERGGRPTDADNLVLLVKEMRAAFGSRFGLSLTLARDYWYLRGFKSKAMEPYVDFMGFMAYDLHGPWDTDVKALGCIFRPHTDITELYNNLRPLWFEGVDPSKINNGLAYFGRTYKLADPACGTMNQCKFTGPGSAGKCTSFEGVLSNREIRDMINEEGYTPYLNKTAMVKYMNYDGDSWVGYDDEETIATTEEFASSMCLGGAKVWSVDFDATVGASGGRSNNLGYRQANGYLRFLLESGDAALCRFHNDHTLPNRHGDDFRLHHYRHSTSLNGVCHLDLDYGDWRRQRRELLHLQVTRDNYNRSNTIHDTRMVKLRHDRSVWEDDYYQCLWDTNSLPK